MSLLRRLYRQRCDTRLASAIQKSSPALSAGELNPLPSRPAVSWNAYEYILQAADNAPAYFHPGVWCSKFDSPTWTLRCLPLGFPPRSQTSDAALGDKKPFGSTLLKLLKLEAVRSKPPAPCIHPCTGQLCVSEHGASGICMLMTPAPPATQPPLKKTRVPQPSPLSFVSTYPRRQETRRCGQNCASPPIRITRTLRYSFI